MSFYFFTVLACAAIVVAAPRETAIACLVYLACMLLKQRLSGR
jgi:hypothetical protein